MIYDFNFKETVNKIIFYKWKNFGSKRIRCSSLEPGDSIGNLTVKKIKYEDTSYIRIYTKEGKNFKFPSNARIRTNINRYQQHKTFQIREKDKIKNINYEIRVANKIDRFIHGTRYTIIYTTCIFNYPFH